MAKVHDGISDDLAAWLTAQHVFFVATAPLSGDGHINVSPRGLDCFSVLGPRRVAWVDLAGSGAETIAHVRENGRIVLMWCAFDGNPNIVRLHGRGRVCPPGTAEFDEVVALHPPHLSTRAVVVVDVERVSDSCGFGVPLMEFAGERDLLRKWAERKGPEGVATYIAEKNAESLDGLPAL